MQLIVSRNVTQRYSPLFLSTEKQGLARTKVILARTTGLQGLIILATDYTDLHGRKFFLSLAEIAEIAENKKVRVSPCSPLLNNFRDFSASRVWRCNLRFLRAFMKNHPLCEKIELSFCAFAFFVYLCSGKTSCYEDNSRRIKYSS